MFCGHDREMAGEALTNFTVTHMTVSKAGLNNANFRCTSRVRSIIAWFLLLKEMVIEATSLYGCCDAGVP